MDKNVKVKWMKALRSGVFKQTTGLLKDEFGHCCLGVLCEVQKWDLVTEVCGNPKIFLSDLEQSVGLVDNEAIQLVDMNDGVNEYTGNPQSFAQIADWIEEHL